METTRLSAAEIESQFTVRPATMADLDRVLELINFASRHYTGEEQETREGLAHEWEHEEVSVENNIRLVLTSDDKLIAYIQAADTLAPFTQMGAWSAIHPDYENSGVGEYLFSWAENRLRESLHKPPAEAKVIMRMAAPSQNIALHQAALAIGLEVVRVFYTMQFDFDGPPIAPVWPEGISVRTFIKGQDDQAVYNVLTAAFRDHWGYMEQPFETWKYFMVDSEEFDPTLCFLAVNTDNKIIGVAVCEDSPAEMPGYGWVEELAVEREGRGKGLGMALLRHAFAEFYRRGNKGCGLGVDTENLTGSLRLYEKAGFRPINNWNIYFKTLRDGVDYQGE